MALAQDLWSPVRWQVALEHARAGVPDQLDWLLLAALAMLASGIVAALFLQCVAAPYGRYQSSPTAAAFGFPVPGRLAWILQELPSFAWPAFVFATVDKAQLSLPQRILFLLFLAHYFNRTFIFPLRILDGKPTPFMVFLMALGFCLWNGWLQAYGILHSSFPPGYADSPQFLFGLLLFFMGMGINVEADATLRNLRADPARKSGYYIPYGGMFEYVSGANFFGEIVEWTGFAVASNFSIFAVAFAVFTACNIGPRAVHHHRWYLEKFRETYPSQRKALIPFLL